MKSSKLTRPAALIKELDLSFRIGSLGMSVMLIWGGLYKMTVPGADGIVPLVTNSPLISWHFKLLGPYVGADVIGLTEITAALLILIGYFRPKAGIIGGLIATLMFFITSTMFISTPGTVAPVNGMHYMTTLGLFLFKDIMALSVALSLVVHFSQKASLTESKP